MVGIRDDGARRRMLETPELTLQSAADICRASENATASTSAIRVLVTSSLVKISSYQKSKRQRDARVCRQRGARVCRPLGWSPPPESLPSAARDVNNRAGLSHLAREILLVCSSGHDRKLKYFKNYLIFAILRVIFEISDMKR